MYLTGPSQRLVPEDIPQARVDFHLSLWYNHSISKDIHDLDV